MRILVLFLVVVSLFLVQCGSFHPMAQSQGPAGPQGPPGPIGPAGPVGPAGPQGATGPQGPIGLTGAPGAMGAVGAQGPIGPAGPQGIAGQGFSFRGPYVPGNSYNAYDLTTEGGSTYVALQANQNVDPATDVTNAGGHWAVEALAGAQGQTGPAGAQGPIGFPGAPGPQGPAGPTGPQGVQGPQGAASTVPGPTGPTGPTGPAGPAALSSALVDTSTISIPFVSTSYVNGGLPVLSVVVGQSGIVQAISKVAFVAQPAAATDGVCYVNSTANGALPPDDSTAAVVYVPLPLVTPSTNVPVASGGVTNTYAGLTPGSRVTVAMFVRTGNLSGPFVCQTASETLNVLTY